MTERLVAAAIVRDGLIHSKGFKQHWRIRNALGDENPTYSKATDQEGFLTSTGRFVSRYDAVAIGIESGQVSPSWQVGGRSLLWTDISW